MKTKKILSCAILSVAAVNAHAQGNFQVSLGSMSYDLSTETSIPDLDYKSSDSDSDSGAILGLGYTVLYDKTYAGVNLYLPNTDDTAFMLEGSYQYMITNNIYAGGFGGYFNWESDDLDLSGISLGLSAGALFLNNKLDINAKYRFLNGSSDKISGVESGYNYTSEAEFDSSMQVTVGYNFGL
ncbi:hypothetical protein ABMA58_02960 [Oceanospirillum sp. HFRX-1_2]